MRGAFTFATPLAVPSGSHIIGEAGTSINSTMTSTGDFTKFVFGAIPAFSGTGLLTSDATVGSNQIAADVKPTVGTWVWLLGATHLYLAAQYQVVAASGASSPYPLTLDRAVQLPFATGDHCYALTTQVQDITIEGNGMTITGTGDRFVELEGAYRCKVSGLNMTLGTTSMAGASLDIGSFNSSFERINVDGGGNASTYGVLMESAEKCKSIQCNVTRAANGITMYDSAVSAIVDCNASSCSSISLNLTSNGMTLGCYKCRVRGGSYDKATSNSISVAYATDCVWECVSSIGSATGFYFGTGNVRCKFIACHTGANSTQGWYLGTGTNPTLIGCSSLGDVRTATIIIPCEIVAPNFRNSTAGTVFVDAGITAGSRINVVGGVLGTTSAATNLWDQNGAAQTSFTDTQFECMTPSAANQICIRHRPSCGTVTVRGVKGIQASACIGYYGEAGSTLRREGNNDFSAMATPWVVNATGVLYDTIQPTLGANLSGTADETINVFTGSLFFQQAGTMTGARAKTLGVTGVDATYGNNLLCIVRWDVAAYALTVKNNAGSAIYAFPASLARAALFRYDLPTTDWIYVGSHAIA
jgi:hypothetical protein